jgi:hypothetical protein
MENHFDAYYKWLGIPPRDQPPNHYRLLGIELFESDRDVIDAAANRVMSYLKDLAVGDDAHHSQKLLNEVARARLCLLNRKKKDDYDAELRQKTAADERQETAAPPALAMDSPSEPAGPPPVPPPAAPGVPAALVPNLNVPRPAARPVRRPVRSAAGNQSHKVDAKLSLLAVAGTAVILLVVVGLGALLLSGGGNGRTAFRSPPDVSLPSGPRVRPGDTAAAERAKRRPPRLPGSDDSNQDPQGQGSPNEDALSPSPKLPTLPDWNDTGTSPDRKNTGPGVLPERRDFVDSSPTPEPLNDSPATMETSPDQPEAGQPPATTDDENPFRDMPPTVALPALGTGAAAPSVLGTIYLNASQQCAVELQGGDKAVRSSQVFTLRNAEGGSVQRGWDILLGEDGNETKLAHLEIDAAGSLVFRWETAADAIESAAHLGNCVLVFSSPGTPPHALALRQPVQSERLVIDLEKTSPKADMRIDALPDSAATFVEIIGLGGVAFAAKPGTVLSADRGESWLTIEDAGGLLVLKVACSIRRNALSLEASPHLLPADSSDPKPLVVKRFPQLMKDAVQYGQSLQANMHGASQALNKNPPAPQRMVLQQRLNAMQHQEKEYQDYVLRLNQLEAFLDTRKNTVEFQVRVYHEIDGSKIDLFVTNGSPAETP